MEANSQIPVGENSLPEAIQDKNVILVGGRNVGKEAAKTIMAKDFGNATIVIAELGETASKVFPKGFL